MRLLVVFSLFICEFAYGYVQTVTGEGRPVQWPIPFKINLSGNSSNTSGISENQLFNAVVKGLQRWKESSPDSILFDYWQGNVSNIYPTQGGYDKSSSLYFASRASGSRLTGPGVLGLTQVWYNPSDGRVLEIDIELNDVDYQFTTNPRDTTGTGAGFISQTTGKRKVYIENVLTHELGHAIGLSHSAQLQSTMLYIESPEQAHLGCDDQTGVRSLYGNSQEKGFIAGSVLQQNGAAVFGAYVQAISVGNGTVVGSAITNQNGEYVFKDLKPGGYHLMAEPHYANSSTLPAYYSGIQSRVCSGQFFTRTFIQDSSSNLTRFDVSPGQMVRAPDVRVKCGSLSDDYVPGKQIFDGAMDDSFGIVTLNSGSERVYKLARVSGDLSLRAMSFSLYSPIQSYFQLTNSFGEIIQTEVSSPVYRGDSGYANYDVTVSAKNLPFGDYYLRVGATYLNAVYYPAGYVALDANPFLVLLGQLDDEIQTNARCRSSENFSAYSSPMGLPQKQSTPSTGFCGTIRKNSNDKGSIDPFQVLSWFYPFMIISVWRGVTCMRRPKRLT
jgi:hypothetical protein